MPITLYFTTYSYIPKANAPIAMAIDAPINVFKKFTTSLDIQVNPSFSCNVAPIKLSIMVATNEANVATPTPAMDGTNPTMA